MTFKECAKCKELKVFEDFNKDRSAKDGLQRMCKKCKSEYHLANRDHNNAVSKNKYERNKDKISARTKASKEIARSQNPQKVWAMNTIKTHKKNGYIIVLTLAELLEIAKKTVFCPICGCEINWLAKKSLRNSPSLDRKYNGKRISNQTCWIICYRCNTMKCDLPFPEYVAHCKKVVDLFEGEIL